MRGCSTRQQTQRLGDGEGVRSMAIRHRGYLIDYVINSLMQSPNFFRLPQSSPDVEQKKKVSVSFMKSRPRERESRNKHLLMLRKTKMNKQTGPSGQLLPAVWGRTASSLSSASLSPWLLLTFASEPQDGCWHSRYHLCIPSKRRKTSLGSQLPFCPSPRAPPKGFCTYVPFDLPG